jgi:hypothetical protein
MIEVVSKYYRINDEEFSGPAGREWKHFGGDAAMVPDRGFTKQLKALDPELEVVWDWGRSRWEIWRVPRDGKDPFYMITVETENKEYRELGADVLLKLQQSDPTRYSLNELVAYFDEMDKQAARRRSKLLKDKIEAVALDTFSYAQGIMQVQVPKTFSIERMVRV